MRNFCIQVSWIPKVNGALQSICLYVCEKF